jgi:hypothetical protein
VFSAFLVQHNSVGHRGVIRGRRTSHRDIDVEINDGEKSAGGPLGTEMRGLHKIRILREIPQGPVLGTGKTDYRTLTQLLSSSTSTR